jgi:hypothetical protein
MGTAVQTKKSTLTANDAHQPPSQMPKDAVARMPEPFVDAETAAAFTSLTRRRVLELARAGSIPAYAIGKGQRKTWLFKLSLLARAMEPRLNCDRQPPAPEQEMI